MSKEFQAIQDPVMKDSLIRRIYEKTLFNPENGCIEWTAKAVHNKGYGKISSSRDIGPLRVHRVVWVLNNGEIPEGLFVMHSCDNPKCCNIEHLSLGTNLENMEDMSNKGRHFSPFKGRKGIDVSNASISDDIAKGIWLSTLKKSEIAKLFDVTYKVVCDVKYRKTWTHVTDLLNSETQNGLDY